MNERNRPLPGHQRGGGGIVVLVVDDDAHVLRYVKRLLESAAYTTLTESDPEAALRHLRDGAQPQLLISDLQMPAIEGNELARRVRQLIPDMPVLFMTGGACECPEPDPGAGEEPSLLQKPFSPQDLLAAVGDKLKRRGLAPHG